MKKSPSFLTLLVIFLFSRNFFCLCAFFFKINKMMNRIPTIFTFEKEKKLFIRENFLKYFHTSAYLLATTIVQIFNVILYSLFLSLPLYFISSLNASAYPFFLFTLFLLIFWIESFNLVNLFISFLSS
jgi:hypothetical protein